MWEYSGLVCEHKADGIPRIHNLHIYNIVSPPDPFQFQAYHQQVLPLVLTIGDFSYVDPNALVFLFWFR